MPGLYGLYVSEHLIHPNPPCDLLHWVVGSVPLAHGSSNSLFTWHIHKEQTWWHKPGPTVHTYKR